MNARLFQNVFRRDFVKSRACAYAKPSLAARQLSLDSCAHKYNSICIAKAIGFLVFDPNDRKAPPRAYTFHIQTWSIVFANLKSREKNR